MRNILFILIFIPIVANGQKIYSGICGEFKHNWTLKIGVDNSVIMTRNIDNSGYEEYFGTIQRVSDSIFNITAKLTYGQSICRSLGDSILYVSLDTVMQKKILNVFLINKNGRLISVSIDKRNRFNIPLDKHFYSSDKDNNFFQIFAGHKNPISGKIVTTYLYYGIGSCLEFFTGNESKFNVIVNKDKIIKITEIHKSKK